VQRILFYLNVLIGIILLAAIGAAYWTLWRPLPKTSGTVALRIEGKGQVVRDALGVPHIQAASIEDALFLQGYVTAQDRLWQMDTIRRLASGELSEVIGAATIEADREARRLRLRRAAEDHAARIPPADRAFMAAYARGVNAFIEENRSRLPVEFLILGYQPRPWAIADTIVIGLQMYRSLTTTWQHDLAKFQMLQGGVADRVNRLYPIRAGGEFQPGSNAWVATGKWTATGKPILVNDPHLEFSFPSTWYQIHLQGGALNVTGVSLPGAPGVIIGHNQRIAWGMTNLGYDVQDLYWEQIDPASGRYLHKGAVEQARLENDVIRVKGAAPVTFSQWVTRHGPVSAFQNTFHALRWVATESGQFEFPFIQLNLASNWNEFREALRRYPGPGQNLVYADTAGNIGYQATGRLPIRRNFDGDLPVSGATGEFEWDGFIPFDELPRAFNPASQHIITANQNPWPAEPGFRLHGEFAAPFRARQIRWRLESKTGWTPAEMVKLQADVYSPMLHGLARHLARSWRAAKGAPAQETAVRQLEQWNGQMEPGSAAALVASMAYPYVKRQLAEAASPGKSEVYNAHIAPGAILQLLDERPPGWFPDWDKMLTGALTDALDETARKQGPDASRWRYGAQMGFTLGHPILARLPLIGSYFQIGPLEMSGSTTTVKQTTLRMGPSMRFAADLSNWEQSLNNITVGQSGHALSGHFKDQWEHYFHGVSFPMQFAQVDGKQTLTVTPQR
jgi:penicillin amidase